MNGTMQDRFIEVINKRGIKKQTIAKIINKDPNTVTNKMSGKNTFTIKEVEAIIDTQNFSTSEKKYIFL